MVDTAEDLDIFSVESDLHIAEDGESTFGTEALRLFVWLRAPILALIRGNFA